LRCDAIPHQSFIAWSTSLGLAEAGNLKFDFMAKKASIKIQFFGFNTFLDVMEIPKQQKPC